MNELIVKDLTAILMLITGFLLLMLVVGITLSWTAALFFAGGSLLIGSALLWYRD